MLRLEGSRSPARDAVIIASAVKGPSVQIRLSSRALWNISNDVGGCQETPSPSRPLEPALISL